jgi:hypothetical protein
MSLCRNRTAQAIGECKKALPFCTSLHQKIEILNSMLELLNSAAPHTPIYYFGATVQQTGERVLLSAKNVIPLILNRIQYLNVISSKTEAA